MSSPSCMSDATTLLLGDSPRPKLRRASALEFSTPKKVAGSSLDGKSPGSPKKMGKSKCVGGGSSLSPKSPKTTKTVKIVVEPSKKTPPKSMKIVLEPPKKTPPKSMKIVLEPPKKTQPKSVMKVMKVMKMMKVLPKKSPTKVMKKLNKGKGKGSPMSMKGMKRPAATKQVATCKRPASKRPAAAKSTAGGFDPRIQEIFERAIDEAYMEYQDMVQYNKSFFCPPACLWSQCFVLQWYGTGRDGSSSGFGS